MSSEEYGKVIAKNLKRIAYEHHKTQADIDRDLLGIDMSHALKCDDSFLSEE